MTSRATIVVGRVSVEVTNHFVEAVGVTSIGLRVEHPDGDEPLYMGKNEAKALGLLLLSMAGDAG